MTYAATDAPSSITPTRSTREWQAADAAHFLHPFTDFQGLARKGSRVITRADNIYLWDSDGNKLLDAMSGLWCVNVGYGQQALVEAAAKQMQQLPIYNAFFQAAFLEPPAGAELAAMVANTCAAIGIQSVNFATEPATAPSGSSLSVKRRPSR